MNVLLDICTWIGDFSSPSVDVPHHPSPSAPVSELPEVHHTTIRSKILVFFVNYCFLWGPEIYFSYNNVILKGLGHEIE
jgi:hypothetical protein